MLSGDDHDYELLQMPSDRPATNEEAEIETRNETSVHPPPTQHEQLNIDPDLENDRMPDDDTLGSSEPVLSHFGSDLDRRTVRKLDYILLPFLALLFLLNSLDKSNIGNAESAGFTRDAGLEPSDLNFALAFFFAFFVGLQPIGAALGRKFGMAYWVPPCMALWGLCTILHIYVHKRWQLVCLRIAIASLEAGFYPTAVSYLSLFYTRYEFAVRLGIFYGQTAMAGALGGVLSWLIFSHYEKSNPDGASGPHNGVKSWEVLFMIEGCVTMVVALVGFFWLPHSADTAWFFTKEERRWAEQRIILDRDEDKQKEQVNSLTQDDRPEDGDNVPDVSIDDPHHRLLDGHTETDNTLKQESSSSLTAESGLNRQDILSAIFSYHIWHLLTCNILSAIPATAFGVFLPMVIKELSPSLNITPAASNLLSVPPFAFGVIVLFIFTRWSDRSRKRLIPILWSLNLLLIGLIMTVLIPRSHYYLRYGALCILLSGSFIASPLTVAWLSNNTPQPAKRAILLGINGWGNLAGLFSALLFTPEDAESGYIRPFIVTLACVATSFAGFIAFWVVITRENKWREKVTRNWTAQQVQREETTGDMPLPSRRGFGAFTTALNKAKLLEVIRGDGVRRGDEKLTFRYGF